MNPANTAHWSALHSSGLANPKDPSSRHTQNGDSITLQRLEFDQLYTEHSQAIFYLALRMLGSSAAAEDATHDVFLKAYRKMDQFRGAAKPRTWLYRITINHCINTKNSWKSRHIVHAGFPETYESMPDKLPRSEYPSQRPDNALQHKELGERIQRTLDLLSEEYRLLLLLIADEKLSYEEIAELTQQSTDSVRGKLYRARKAFSSQFEKIEKLQRTDLGSA